VACMQRDTYEGGVRVADVAAVSADLLVVGAGPVGLYAAYYAGFRGLSVAVIDSLPEPGGQVTALYPEKLLFDVAGFPSVRGRDLIDRLVEQAADSEPIYLLGEQAVGLDRRDQGVVVSTSAGRQIHAGAVVVTGGIGTFSPRPLPSGARHEGRGLVYFVPRLHDHAHKDVVIVGGGDSAFDWAVSLTPIARSVTLVHRRERFRAHERTVQQVRDSGIEILTSSVVHSLHGEGGVESVEVVHEPTKSVRTLPAQSVIAALGFSADLGPLERWGLEIHERRILVDTRMATNVDRVYAAGDINDYPGKVRLIAVGFGEAATAVNNAAVALDPSLALFPGHSSDA
jgi:thioredoxin reductase